MNDEKVILVNERDEEIGLAGKLEAHEKGLMHRAISVVLFQKENPALTLIQQRSAVKYHSPLLWANTCCSHPRAGEAPEAAAMRRVKEELDIAAPPLSFAGTVTYRADVPPHLVEHEISHVFTGFLGRDAVIPCNPAEVAATGWIDAGDWPQNRKYVPWIGKMIYKALTLGISPIHKDILKRHEAAA
jgi:isopentenyl-diphosphate delta-isomerase